MYRENAKKTNNPTVQLEFAKYLVACAAVLGEPCSTSNDYDSGKPANKNSKDLLEEANFWIRRLQKSGDPEATYILGTWVENGLYGFSPNPYKAFALYNKSSKLGFVKAIHKVAIYHEARKEYSKAQQFFLKAASQGSTSANYRLAKAYMHGELKLKPNINQGILYLTRAVNSNDSLECPEASYIYGLILTGAYTQVDVSSIPKDVGMAHDLIEKAAELGYTPALYKLGYSYEFGELGYKIDPAKSIFYYKQGAERGDPECQMGLSGWYLSGVPGVLEPNDDLAYSWCNQAASKGLPKAEFAMGYYYELGVGVPKDMSMANFWYVRAASHGSKEAQSRLERGDESPPHPIIAGARAQGLHKEMKDQKKQTKEDCIVS
ncbi:HCP-like protein [Basidiobolus meristosporus CBS 931.73]|uniref:HCP-like protein n=1 Tax=Basidiobolus meristosporus CBS 931.73 TaxID=1314790 RepID=A0A1Y1Z0S7_9FUNG|nr:HCP-like protein [Basidiobolus meristosporus CBS 931.73]|eukprot:ORY03537.1 HCP-like protein [Basidiobolus meristosporus CBS 931.73]